MKRERIEQDGGVFQRALRIAVVGATGVVGEVLLEVLRERNTPVEELRLLASARSAGSRIRFGEQEIEVAEARPEAFDGVDVVFFAATGELSRSLAPEAARRGAIAIDKSGTWRMDPDVPLVVPEINASALDGHQGIVSSPNCTTVGVVMALEPLRRAAGLREVIVTTMQAATGAGREGGDELARQLERTARGEPVVPEIFAAPIAHNVVPLCESFLPDGSSTEETKLVMETRKILASAPGAGPAEASLAMSVTCVRVPVAVGHSASLLVETEAPLTANEAREALATFAGVQVVDDPDAEVFPTPLGVAGRDEVQVGRVRRDPASERLWLWQVADNLRKGAATNAVQIAEALASRRLL